MLLLLAARRVVVEKEDDMGGRGLAAARPEPGAAAPREVEATPLDAAAEAGLAGNSRAIASRSLPAALLPVLGLLLWRPAGVIEAASDLSVEA